MARRILLLTILFLLAASADSVKIGVVVEFPNGGIFTKCVESDEGENAYEILQKTGLKITWTKHPEYGHGLCEILDTGCLETECICKSKYWNFHIKEKWGQWTHSPVGFDGGTSCQEHYCAKEGNMLGFTYDAYGKKPGEINYRQVCPEETKEEKIEEPDIIGRAIAFPGENTGYIGAVILLLLLTAYFIHKPWEYF